MTTKPTDTTISTSNTEKHLFIKEGDDIFYQQRNSDSKNASEADGFRTSVYKHYESNMRVVVCRTPSPVFTVDIIMPIAVANDKGLLGAIERVVYCGSKHYPTQGYINALASQNYTYKISFRTNSDHTRFYFSTAAEDAVANILPVFLDSVLNPLLHDDHFATKVYHYDEDGKEQGELFNSMASSQNTALVAFYRLKRLMYSIKSDYTVFNEEMTHTIASLTNKELVEYHHKYYDANNITVLLTGAFSDDFEDKYLQTISADIVKSRGCDSREPMDYSLPSDKHPQHVTLEFPSSDTSDGTIIFGWHGPRHEDAETNIALTILIEYLASALSSPLNMRFVEQSSPLASSVEMHIATNISKVFSIFFYGVPYVNHESTDCSYNNSDKKKRRKDANESDENCTEDSDIPHLFEEHYFENLLLNELKRIHDTQFDGDLHALENAVKLYGDRLASDIEESPSSLIQEMICPDVIASHFTSGLDGKLQIGSQARKFDIIAELAKKPIDYWLGLLKKWLIDGAVYSVAMVPSQELESKLESECKEREQANKARIVDKDAHASYIKKIVEASMAPVPEEIVRNMPTPDLSKPAMFPHTQSLVNLDKAIGPVTAVRVVSADTEFAEIQVQIPIGDIPDNQRAYLVLFQRIFLGADIILPAGVVYDTDDTPLQTEKYVHISEYDTRMLELVTSSFSGVSQSPTLFECNWLDDMFVIDNRMLYKNYAHTLRWIVQAIMFSEFTTDQILYYTQDLLDKIDNEKRNIDNVVFAVETHFTDVPNAGESMSNKRHMSFLAQESVLKGIIEKLRAGKGDKVIEKLNEIQKTLIHATGGFMALSLPSNEDPESYIEFFRSEWQMCYKKYTECNRVAAKSATAAVPKSSFPMAHDNRFSKLTSPLLIHVPVQSLHESNVFSAFKLDISFYPSGKCSIDEEISSLASLDYFALQMLLALLCCTDGPLENLIRKRGHFCRIQLYIGMLSKTLKLEIEHPDNIIRDIRAVKGVILDIQNNWDLYFNESDINLARSLMHKNNVFEQETLVKLLSKSIADIIFGFNSAKEYNTWFTTHTMAVKMTDLRRVYEKYVLKFVDDKYPMFRLLITPSDTKIPAELGVFERKTLEEISATYNTYY